MAALAPNPDDPDVVVVAADRIFAGSGAASLTHERVAAIANVPVDRVRERYSTAVDLVLAVLQFRQEEWVRGLAEASAAAIDPRDEVLTVFSYLESCFSDDEWSGCAFINGYGELGRSEPAVAALADQHLAGVEDHLRRLCADAGLPPFIADGLSLLVQGAKVEAAIHGTTAPARSARMTAAVLMSAYEPDRAATFI